MTAYSPRLVASPSFRLIPDWVVIRKKARLTAVLATLIVACVGAAVAQANDQGFKPFGSYSGSNIDQVDVQNGHVNLRIPLVSYPQRGGRLNVSFSVLYHNAVWNETKDCVPTTSICFNFWKADGFPQVMAIFDQSAPFIESQGVNSIANCPGGSQCTQTAYTLRMADESAHPLGNLHGSLYESLDATAIQADVTSQLVILPNGTRYTTNGFLEDAHGNLVGISGTNIIDTMGRTIPRAGSSTADFSGCTGPLPIVSATSWSVPGPNGSTSMFKFCNVSVSIFTNHWAGKVSIPSGQNYSEPNGPVTMLQSIVLPDQTAWTFEYSQPDANGINWGDLVKITTPTGGTISYTWVHGAGCSTRVGHAGSTSGSVTQRVVDANDGNGPQTWNYKGGTVTDPAGNDTVHAFTDLTGCSLYETQTQFYSGTGSSRALLKIVTTDFSWSASPNYHGNLIPVGEKPPAINVVPIRITTSWPNGVSRKTETDYTNQAFAFFDPYGNASGVLGIYGRQTAVREYDFGSGAPGALLKTTSTAYLWQNSGGAQYLTYNILDVPTSISVLNPQGGGSLSGYSYDESLPTATSGISGRDPSPPNGNVRGNLTTTDTWENGTVVATPHCSVSGVNFFLTQTKTYLDTGVVAQSNDACGHPTINTFAVTPYRGAYLTQTCDALNHCVTMDYDYNTGKIASSVDPNQKRTSYIYDNFGRLTDINYPVGGHAQGLYPDPVTVEIKNLESAATNAGTDSFTYFDGFLRPKQTRSLDPEGDVFTETSHDAFDRVASVTNPHRSVAAPTDGQVKTTYDALGRVTQVQHADKNVVQTQFQDPNITILTDETGRQRREITDALGRLVQVDEPGDPFNGTKAGGSFAIGGSLQNALVGQVSGASASAQVAISGVDAFRIITTRCTALQIEMGCEPSSTTTYHTGKVFITVNGHEYDYFFGNGGVSPDSSATIAQGLVSAIQLDPARVVNASVNPAATNTVVLTAVTAGTGGNSISFSSGGTDSVTPTTPCFSTAPSSGLLAGGQNPSGGTNTVDFGTVSMSVSSYLATAKYGDGSQAGYTDSTAALVAQDLVNQIKAQLPATNPPFSISVPSGGTGITVNWNSVGSAGNIAISVKGTSSNSAFSVPSFCLAISGVGCDSTTRNTTLSGGADAYPSGIAHPYSTFYTYDILGNLAHIEQHGNTTDSTKWRVRNFVYDSASRLHQTTNPEAGTITYNYDADGNVVSRTGPAPSQTQSSGFTTTVNYSYDVVHRMTAKSYTGNGYTDTTPGSTYQYDTACCGITSLNPIGRLTGEFSGNTEILFSYDAMGRPLTTWDCPPSGIARGFCYTHAATYDQLGHVATLTYPDGRNISFSYTFPSNGTLTTGRPTGVKLVSFGGTAFNYPYYTVPQGSSAVTWGYNPDGSLRSGIFGNGVTETYGYNNRAQISAITATGLGQTWMSKSYGLYDANGNNNGDILNIVDPLSAGRSQFYAYDSINRVISGYQQDGSFNQTFSYDPWANMSTSGTNNFRPLYDGNNRIQGAGSACIPSSAYCYDAAGNMLNDAFHQYAYDAESRIKAVDSTGATYTYDAAGERLRKDLGTGSTEYFYFAGTPIAELDPVAGRWSDYVVFGGKRVARNTNFEHQLQISGLMCSGCTGQSYQFQFSSLGALQGRTIKAGDTLRWLQWQNTGSAGGIVITFTDGTSTSSLGMADQNGEQLSRSANANLWDFRTASLSAAAGKTISKISLDLDPTNTATQWAVFYQDIAFAAADMTFTPLFSQNPTVPSFSGSGTAGISQAAASIHDCFGTGCAPLNTTTYYHDDQIGSSRILTNGTGYPIWQGTFTPFGQEVGAQITTNHYKFTGKERGEASEGGLDYFGARYYSSTMGRWMSPDWSPTPTPVPYARIANPQSLNLYAYVMDDPLSNTDLDGHMQFTLGNSEGGYEDKNNPDKRDQPAPPPPQPQPHPTPTPTPTPTPAPNPAPAPTPPPGQAPGPNPASSTLPLVSSLANRMARIADPSLGPEGINGPCYVNPPDGPSISAPPPPPQPSVGPATPEPAPPQFFPDGGQVLTCMTGGDPQIYGGEEPKHIPEENAEKATIYGPTSDFKSTQKVNENQIRQAEAMGGMIAIFGNANACLIAHPEK